MDEELTLHELRRLEAERKLRSIPEAVLGTAWVREAQIEAVIDAVLAVALAGSATDISHARNVGEWCARIAQALPNGPEPGFARRVGVLADVDPAALERIPELKHLAAYVGEYHAFAIDGTVNPRTMTLIVAVADEFDQRITLDANGNAPSGNAVLRSMLVHANDASRPIIEALAKVVHPGKRAQVVA